MNERPRVSAEELDKLCFYAAQGSPSNWKKAALDLRDEREETARLRRLVFEHHSVAMHHWCGAEAQGENWGRPCPVCIEVGEAALAGQTVGEAHDEG